MITILLRCIIIYALLVITMRLTGKRQIGELEVSELITTLLLSELASIPITDSDIPLSLAVIPIFTISSIEIIITYLSSKSPRLRAILSGRPSPVIKNGVINQGELEKLRMSAAELLAQLRVKGISDPCEVKFAFFEEDGQLSVFEKDENNTPMVFAVVCDGHINRFNLRQVGYKISDVQKRLKNKRISDVFLMLVNEHGKVRIIYKEKKRKK